MDDETRRKDASAGGSLGRSAKSGRRRVSEQDRLEEPGVIFVEFVLIGRSAWVKGEFDRREVYYVFAEVPEIDLWGICGVRCRKLRRGRWYPRRL